MTRPRERRCGILPCMTAPTLDAESLRAALRRYPELSKLDHEVLEGLARGAVRQEVPRRRALFTRDQVGPGLFFMLSGEVKVSLISPEGREQLLYLAEAGMMISEGVSLDGRPSRASAFAVEESALLCVPTACVEEATAAAGPLGLALMRLIAKRADRWIDRCLTCPCVPWINGSRVFCWNWPRQRPTRESTWSRGSATSPPSRPCWDRCAKRSLVPSDGCKRPA